MCAKVLDLQLFMLLLSYWWICARLQKLHCWRTGVTVRAGVLVLVLAVLEYWISGTRTVLVLLSYKVIVLVLVDKYSYEYWHEYWYSMVHLMICDVRVKKHHTCQINSLTYHEGKFPNWFILLLWLNIWYMGCDCKFHNVFQFHYHRKSTELLLWCLGLLLSFVQVHFPI